MALRGSDYNTGIFATNKIIIKICITVSINIWIIYKPTLEALIIETFTYDQIKEVLREFSAIIIRYKRSHLTHPQ